MSHLQNEPPPSSEHEPFAAGNLTITAIAAISEIDAAAWDACANPPMAYDARRTSDPAPASGVAKLMVRWGDGTVTQIKPRTHRVVHVYRRPGRYKITVTVADRAGNQTTVVRRVKINPARPGHT